MIAGDELPLLDGMLRRGNHTLFDCQLDFVPS